MTLERTDVIVVGGGPAGATCARHLTEGGASVRLIDAATFPRDKVCAGWITPHVARALALDVDDYAATRTYQPISSFRVGIVGDPDAVVVEYGRPVSACIRRCEFDDYLLRRSGAMVETGHPVKSIRREDGAWVVDERWAAPLLVGAGGSQCPVSRLLNGPSGHRESVVVAREVEARMSPAAQGEALRDPDTAEIYFTADFLGYGWYLRKGDWVNIGLGRLGNRLSRSEVEQFAAFLHDTRGVSPPGVDRWRGHSYVAGAPASLRRSGDGVLLIGDAAGLASDRSGEGIGPAVDSGIAAASFLLQLGGQHDASAFAAYEAQTTPRPSAGEWLVTVLPAPVLRSLAAHLLRRRGFVQNVVLDRWFLHAGADAPAA